MPPIDDLARFLRNEFPDEVLPNDSVVDMAIRVMAKFRNALAYQSGRLSTFGRFAGMNPMAVMEDALDFADTSLPYRGISEYLVLLAGRSVRSESKPGSFSIRMMASEQSIRMILRSEGNTDA